MNTVTGRRRIGLARNMALAIGVVWSCFLCGAAQSAVPKVYTLHVASQPLDAALQDFARQTGLQIVFFSRLTDGRRSAALDGMYTLDAAMTALLSESKLTYRLINPKTVEIVSLRAAWLDRKSGRYFRTVDDIPCT